MKATALLQQQHREVKALFAQANKASSGERPEVVDGIAEKLIAHMKIEEEIFYPAVRKLATKTTDEMVPEAYEEHHVVKLVLGELPEVDLEDEQFEAKMTVLEELIEHHVEEEEKEMFKVAEKLGDERLRALGAEMESASDNEPQRGKKSASEPAQRSAQSHSARHQ
jgi:hemerythrin-like domain-containing protein